MNHSVDGNMLQLIFSVLFPIDHLILYYVYLIKKDKKKIFDKYI